MPIEWAWKLICSLYYNVAALVWTSIAIYRVGSSSWWWWKEKGNVLWLNFVLFSCKFLFEILYARTIFPCETGQIGMCHQQMDRCCYDPNVKTMMGHHVWAIKKCFPMLCRMPAFCHRECFMPQQKLIMLWPLAGTWYALWPTAIEKTLNAIFSQWRFWGWEVCASIPWHIPIWPVSCTVFSTSHHISCQTYPY